MTLLTPRELDRLLRYPRGRSARLARAGKLPAIFLPDGEIRFNRDRIDSLLRNESLCHAGAAKEGER